MPSLFSSTIHSLHMRARKVRHGLRPYIITGKIAARMKLPLKQQKHHLPFELIISLTSHRPRFSTLHLTLECLLRQSIKADRIILWIDGKDMSLLPSSVTSLAGRGVEIRQSPKNVGSYSKLVHTMKEFPDAAIITTDDDTYYQHHFVKKLIGSWSGNPKEIACAMAFTITTDDQGNKKQFLDWKPIKGHSYPRFDILPFGVGGIFYPPRALPPETLDDAQYMALCPKADDLWFFWMARKNGVTYRKVGGIQWPASWPSSQAVALKHENNVFKNDEQTANLVKAYGWPSFVRA